MSMYEVIGFDPSHMVHNEPTDFEAKKKAATSIREIFERLHKLLNLGYWTIRLEFKMDPADPNDSDSSVVAKCWTRWEYREAHLTFNLHEMADFSYKRMEKVVLHEMMHIFVHPMRMWWPERMEQSAHDHCMKIEEKTVTDLTDAFLSMLNQLQERMLDTTLKSDKDS